MLLQCTCVVCGVARRDEGLLSHAHAHAHGHAGGTTHYTMPELVEKLTESSSPLANWELVDRLTGDKSVDESKTFEEAFLLRCVGPASKSQSQSQSQSPPSGLLGSSPPALNNVPAPLAAAIALPPPPLGPGMA